MIKTNNILILLNIIFLLYYSIQLLIFTDEFSISNLGSFNHAIAGLSEIIGIIFFSLALSLIFIIRNNIKGHIPIFFTIFLIQLLIFINFLRYIFTNSPGETSIEAITFNAFIFFIGLIVSIIFLLKNFQILKQF